MTPEEYKNYLPEYTEEGNIVIAGETIMFAHEEEYITRSIKEIHKRTGFTTVLELGFGLGYTARAFRDCDVKKHVIVEPNKKIYDKAKRWARFKRGVTVINAFWQEVKDLEEHFDLLYFDTYEMVSLNTYPGSITDGQFSYDYYAEFCTPYEGERLGKGSFRFGNYVQLLVNRR